MKKPSWCVIVLGLVLTVFLSFEIKNTIIRKQEPFFVQWIIWLLFSDPGYAKKIDVTPYLLNDEQAAQLLMYPEQEIQQPPQKDLYLRNVNLVLRISNHGRTGPWGTLAYSIDEGAHWFKIDIKDIPPSNSKKQLYNYVIPIGIVVFFNNNELPENIQWKWLSLYTKY